jgi:adenosylcobinamide kinase/adenosylcobinamide-phosphate guanylyltransferase
LNAPERHLVLGGARSGKTRYALQLAELLASRRSAQVVYVATAQAGDAEMAERIARHRAERPVTWRTLEAPLKLADSLSRVNSNTVLVIDCLTLWLSNALLQDFDEQTPRASLPTWTDERDRMLRFAQQFAGALIMVTNEVGAGIVPASALARRFQDEQGWLNQSMAALCEHVTWVMAGIAVPIKSPP